MSFSSQYFLSSQTKRQENTSVFEFSLESIEQVNMLHINSKDEKLRYTPYFFERPQRVSPLTISILLCEDSGAFGTF